MADDVGNSVEIRDATVGTRRAVVDANGNLAVALAAGGSVASTKYTTLATGELQGSASALQMPSVACSLARFKARGDNAGNVYIGVSGVTKPDGTTDTTTGIELSAGEDSGWIPVDNINRFFRICDNAGDDLTYMVLA